MKETENSRNRSAIARSYLGKTVTVIIDRPLGSAHAQYPNTVYPINYGYIPGTTGGDGEEIDVYLLGVDHPVKEYIATVIGIVFRENDGEDKLVAAPAGVFYHQGEIAEAVHFQERYFKTHIDAIYQKSCGAIIFRKNGSIVEYLCLQQKKSGIFSVPKGHMEAFETEEETALREIKEEAGITVAFLPGFKKEIRYKLPFHKHKLLILFLAEYNGNLSVNRQEISRYSWLPYKKAKHTLPKGYSEAMEQAKKVLEQ